MPYTSQHTRDVPNLSYEYDCNLLTGFPFALVFSTVKLAQSLGNQLSTRSHRRSQLTATAPLEAAPGRYCLRIPYRTTVTPFHDWCL